MLRCLLGSFLLCCGPAGQAQWITQTVALNPGWNAVCLEVQPAHPQCTSLFADLPVESVWRWSQRAGRSQFIADPSQLLPRSSDWLYWLPPDHPHVALNTLFAVHAGDSCLIKLAADAAPVSWRIKGTPVPCRRQWLGGGLNLAGLPVPPQTATFEDFFRPTPAIAVTRADGGEMYQIGSNGQGLRLWEPGRVRIQPGTAYWIRCRTTTDYTGPLRVELDHGRVLEFPEPIWTRRLTVRNESAAAKTVTIRILPSEDPPPGDFAKVAGPVALEYREKDWSQGPPRDVFRPLAPQVSRSVAPGETWRLELTPRRQEMAGAAPEALWQSLIEIGDGATVRQVVGVRAE